MTPDEIAAVLADELDRLLRDVPTNDQILEHDKIAKAFVAEKANEIENLIEAERRRAAAKGVPFNQEKVYDALLPKILERVNVAQYKDKEGPLY